MDPGLIETIVNSGKSLAHWCVELGMKEVELLGHMQLRHEAIKNADPRKAGQLMRVIKRFDTARKVATGAGALAPAATGASWVVRLLIGGALVVGICLVVYLGYRIFFAEQSKPADVATTGPTNLGETGGTTGTKDRKNFTEGPLEGKTEVKGLPSTPPGPVRDDFATARREMIELPEGAGVEEILKSGTYTASAAALTPAEKQWQKQIAGAMDDLYHQGAFDGFTGVWFNYLNWKPLPAVIKAELKHNEDRTVTGFLWINTGEAPGGFKTRKLPVTRGIASGARGREYLEIELLDGRIRGTLKINATGGALQGELDGCFVSLISQRHGDARKALESKFPRPAKAK